MPSNESAPTKRGRIFADAAKTTPTATGAPLTGLKVVVGETVVVVAVGNVVFVDEAPGALEDAQAESNTSPTTMVPRAKRNLGAHVAGFTARFNMMLIAYNRDRAPLWSHLTTI